MSTPGLQPKLRKTRYIRLIDAKFSTYDMGGVQKISDFNWLQFDQRLTQVLMYSVDYAKERLASEL